MASRTGTLYTGITSNLVRRVIQHQDHLIPGFTSRYNINKLLYYETFNTPKEAIQREKEIKGWRREKKIKLIEAKNPNWLDLSKAWYVYEKQSDLNGKIKTDSSAPASKACARNDQ